MYAWHAGWLPAEGACGCPAMATALPLIKRAALALLYSGVFTSPGCTLKKSMPVLCGRDGSCGPQ